LNVGGERGKPDQDFFRRPRYRIGGSQGAGEIISTSFPSGTEVSNLTAGAGALLGLC
jgi:hypothetical protein